MQVKRLIQLTVLAFALTACDSNSYKKKDINEVWITMSDGIRLAADIYWPLDDVRKDRFPMVFKRI